MQITIDTDTSSPRQMRAAAKVLVALALFAESGADTLDLPALVVTAAELRSVGAPVPDYVHPIPPPPSNVVNFPPPAAQLIPPPPAHFAIPPAAPVSVASAILPADSVPAGTSPWPTIDSRGLPWDPRINSAGENRLNDDGSWRRKRGASESLVNSVETELRVRSQQAPPPPAPVSLPVPPPIAALPVPPPPAAVFESQQRVAPVDASVPPPPASTTGTVPANGPTLTQLITQVNRYGAENRYDMTKLIADTIACGGTLDTLGQNPALIAAVWNRMEMSVGAPRA